MSRKLVFMFVSVLCLSFVVIGVKAHDPSYEIVAVYGSTPTIDGAINIHEWNDADSISFNKTEVLIKQDGVNLYIGFNMSYAPSLTYDQVVVVIDVDDDGGLTLQPDDIGLVVYANGTLGEANVTDGVWTPVEITGWSAETQSNPSMWQIEFNITYSKIDVTAGVEKTIGAAFMSTYAATTHYTWPPNWDYPSKWGAITSTGYDWTTDAFEVLVHPVVWESETYYVMTKSNSTITDLALEQPSKSLTFWMGGENDTRGYVNVTIPKSLLHLNPSKQPFEWMVFIGSAPLTIPTPVANATHTFIYLEYNHPAPRCETAITIMGNEVIPEFPSIMILPLLMTIAMLTVVFTKKKNYWKKLET